MTIPAATVRLLSAATSALLAAWIVLVVRIGPVLVQITETHGVHHGDLLAIPLAAISLWLTVPTVVQSQAWIRSSSLLTVPSHG